MNLNKNGKFLSDLRKAKGLTQKQVAEIIGVVPKTVSKWETGNGFPDVSTLSLLADIYEVSERVLLDGSITKNKVDVGNIKRTKFYVCQHCGSTMYGTGESSVVCCGKPVEQLKPQKADESHIINVLEIENDYFIEFNHQMTKDHYINFVAFVGYDRMLLVRMYPEQNPTVRFPKMYRGKLYYYCNKDGLFEHKF